MADDLANRQIQVTSSSLGLQTSFNDLASQLDNQLADPAAALAPGLQQFFNGLGDLATDPASGSARSIFLSESTNLVTRFHDQADRLRAMAQGTNDKITAITNQINSLGQGIAQVNVQIVRVSMNGTLPPGRLPNDLLDSRDKMLADLSKLVGIHTVAQTNGAINVTIGNGQTLVVEGNAMAIGTTPNLNDPTRMEVVYKNGFGPPQAISSQLNGGQLGGVMRFRDEMIEPARNAIGRIAITLAQSFNDQHRQGIDLNNLFGGDFFSVQQPAVLGNANNVGSPLAVTFDAPPTSLVTNIGGLTNSDYSVSYDGANYTVTRLLDKTAQIIPAGALPASVDGMIIDVGAIPPVAGDIFIIQPTKRAAEKISVLFSDPKALALASPIRSSVMAADLSVVPIIPGNLGDGKISTPQVLDVTDPDLQTPAQIVFDDPPTTYQINGGVGAGSTPYVSGADIDLNGWRVQISGTPKAGDTFNIDPNTNGGNDNRNALDLGLLRQASIMDGGTTSYEGAYGAFVADVGIKMQQSSVSMDSQSAALASAVKTQAGISGVNLDEEAANMLRFQQAYQASAQLVKTANTLFDLLFAAMR
jgi:flagellar hook-associated protein 1 FlgK